jgi:hypothetical protein
MIKETEAKTSFFDDVCIHFEKAAIFSDFIPGLSSRISMRMRAG